MSDGSNLLTLYSDVQTRTVKWLWFPYIAYGKITLLQGDPGDGKSSMMMHLIAELSTGGAMPDGTALGKPQRVIYQCSEDGVGDTIKPRLVKLGANCNNVAFINEEVYGNLTLDDERIREAIIEFEPKLLVIDPVQAYIGSDSDLQIAGRARKLMRRLGMWAEAYDCAIVLIGHMNKRESAKGLYRGLGSIDLIAAARSVLQVERDINDPDIRIVSQIKNSLESSGLDIRFEIRPSSGFKWLENTSPKQDDSQKYVLEKAEKEQVVFPTKQEEAAHIICNLLKEKDVKSKDLFHLLADKGISEKTARAIKEELGVVVYRKGGQWYWSLRKNDSSSNLNRKPTKQSASYEFLKRILSQGPVLSSEIEEKAKELKLGFKTVQLVKNNLGIRSVRKDGKWYWFPLKDWEVKGA